LEALLMDNRWRGTLSVDREYTVEVIVACQTYKRQGKTMRNGV